MAPVPETTGNPIEPVMAHVVVVDAPPVMPAAETMRVASMPGESPIETVAATMDDLASLRQRLAQEQIQLPPVRFQAGPPKRPRTVPLLRGDF